MFLVRRWSVLFAVAVCIPACNRGGSGSPSAPGDVASAASVLTLKAARGGMPVVGATVSVDGGRPGVTDAFGLAVMAADADGRTVTVTMAGFTGPRKFTYRAGMTDYLLPDDAQLQQAWLMTAYYAGSPSQVLVRPESGSLSVTVDSEGRADRNVWDAVTWGTAKINEAQHHVGYGIVDGSAGSVRIYHDANDPVFSKSGFENAWAVTYRDTRGAVVIGARIVFKFYTDRNNDQTFVHLRKAVAHELGHVTGIIGHPPGGIMGSSAPLEDFSPQEKEALGYLFLREPGTRPTDDSTGLVHVAGAGTTATIICILYE